MDIVSYVIIVVLALFLCGTLGVIVLTFTPRFHNISVQSLEFNTPFLVLIQTAASVLTFLIWRMAVTLKSGKDFWEAVQWRWPERMKILRYMALGVGMTFIVSIAQTFLPMPDELPIEKMYSASTDAWLMLTLGVAIAPIIEEIFFRGLLFPVAERSLGARGGLWLTAVMFALIHQAQLAHALVPMLIILFVGYVLTSVRARTGSLAASWIVHTTYNATLFIFMLIGTDGFRELDKVK